MGGASISDIADKFGISEGAVDLCTNRTSVALIFLEHNVVHWPTSMEKQVLKSEISRVFGFLSMVEIVDGTFIVLAYKPTKNGRTIIVGNYVTQF